MKAKDLKQNPPKILIYGPHGTGKTALIAQAKNGYLIDADNGMRTALLLQDKFTPLRHNIEFDTFTEDPQKPSAWIKIKEKVFSINREIRKGTWQYDALCLDSLTRMATYCTNQVLYQAGKIFEAPQLQHYNIIVTEMRNILQLVTSLPVLVLVATHEVPIETDDGVIIRPRSVGSRLPDEVCAMFDEVWYSKTKRLPSSQGYADYIASCIPSNVRDSRTRSGTLLEVSIKDIGLDGLLNKMGFNQEALKCNNKLQVVEQ